MTATYRPKAMVFDFDGVIMDSIPVKTNAFGHILREFPKEQVTLLLEYHKENGGVPRRKKLEYFFQEIAKTPTELEKIAEYEDEFGKYVLKTLSNPEYLIQECVDFIEANCKKTPIYVASAAFQTEVDFLSKIHGFYNCFKGVYGHPSKKPAVIRQILTELNIDKSELVFIGDSMSDVKAGTETGVNFWAYNNLKLKEQSINYIPSFQNWALEAFASA